MIGKSPFCVPFLLDVDITFDRNWTLALKIDRFLLTRAKNQNSLAQSESLKAKNKLRKENKTRLPEGLKPP